MSKTAIAISSNSGATALASLDNAQDSNAYSSAAQRQAKLRGNWDDSEREKRSLVGEMMQMRLAGLLLGFV